MSNLGKVQVCHDIDLDTIIYELTTQLDHEQLVNFVLTLDEQVAELEFTLNLYRALGEVIVEETNGKQEIREAQRPEAGEVEFREALSRSFGEPGTAYQERIIAKQPEASPEEESTPQAEECHHWKFPGAVCEHDKPRYSSVTPTEPVLFGPYGCNSNPCRFHGAW